MHPPRRVDLLALEGLRSVAGVVGAAAFFWPPLLGQSLPSGRVVPAERPEAGGAMGAWTSHEELT